MQNDPRRALRSQEVSSCLHPRLIGLRQPASTGRHNCLTVYVHASFWLHALRHVIWCYNIFLSTFCCWSSHWLQLKRHSRHVCLCDCLGSSSRLLLEGAQGQPCDLLGATGKEQPHSNRLQVGTAEIKNDVPNSCNKRQISTISLGSLQCELELRHELLGKQTHQVHLVW